MYIRTVIFIISVHKGNDRIYYEKCVHSPLLFSVSIHDIVEFQSVT